MTTKSRTVKPGDTNWHLPTNDYAFKALFANPGNLEITAGFLNDFFGIDVPPEEIRFLRDSSIDSIAYRDDATEEELQRLVETIRDITIGIDLTDITIELQVLPQKRFVWRAVHYLTSVYNARYDATKGPMPDGRPRDRFRNLKPAWGMNIVDFTLFPDDGEPYRMFTLRDEVTAQTLLEAPLRLGFFEIPKQISALEHDLRGDVVSNRAYWAQFFHTGEAPAGAPKYILDAARIMIQINNNPKEARMLTATERFIADRDAQQAYALELGHAQGYAQASKEKVIEHSRNALSQGLEPEMVSSITGLPLVEVLALDAVMKR